jgi:hypothetical protein
MAIQMMREGDERGEEAAKRGTGSRESASFLRRRLSLRS